MYKNFVLSCNWLGAISAYTPLLKKKHWKTEISEIISELQLHCR